jgi:hypothetical protein
VHAGGYRLTPADGQAQRAGSAGSRAGSVPWPVRSGLVPPLAEGFTTRPDTVPSLEAALVPGAAVALVPVRMPGARRTGRDRPARPSSRLTWPTRCGSHAKWTCWAGWRPAAGLDPVRLPPVGADLGGMAPGGRNAPPSAHPAPGSGCVQWRGGPEGGMRVHSGLPVPIPRPRRLRPRYRDVSRSAEIRGRACSAKQGSGNGRHADRELDGDRRLGLSRPAGGGPAVEMMSVTGVGTVMLRRPRAEIGVVRVLNPPGVDGC